MPRPSVRLAKASSRCAVAIHTKRAHLAQRRRQHTRIQVAPDEQQAADARLLRQQRRGGVCDLVQLPHNLRSVVSAWRMIAVRGR